MRETLLAEVLQFHSSLAIRITTIRTQVITTAEQRLSRVFREDEARCTCKGVRTKKVSVPNFGWILEKVEKCRVDRGLNMGCFRQKPPPTWATVEWDLIQGRWMFYGARLEPPPPQLTRSLLSQNRLRRFIRLASGAIRRVSWLGPATSPAPVD